MKLVFAFLALVCLAAAQDIKNMVITTSDGAVVRMQAENMLHEPNLVHLKGKVEIRTYWSGQPAERCVVLRADEAVYHVDTGEIEPQGNVSVRPAVER